MGFVCKFCQKTFNSIINLVQHLGGHLYKAAFKQSSFEEFTSIWEHIMEPQYQTISLTAIESTLQLFIRNEPISEIHKLCANYIVSSAKSRLPYSCLPKIPLIQTGWLDSTTAGSIETNPKMQGKIFEVDLDLDALEAAIEAEDKAKEDVVINLVGDAPVVKKSRLEALLSADTVEVKVVKTLSAPQLCMVCFEIVYENAYVFSCHDAHCIHLHCFECKLCQKTCSFKLDHLQFRQICRRVIGLESRALMLNCANGHSQHIDCFKCTLCNPNDHLCNKIIKLNFQNSFQ